MAQDKFNLSGAQFAGGFAETIHGDQAGGVVVNKMVKEDLNALAHEIWLVNANNGFDVAIPDDWEEGEQPNVDKLMRITALIHTEVAEATEAIRKGDLDNFVEELADTIIRCLDVAGGLGVDIDKTLRGKLKKNRSRGYRHGGKLA